MSENIKYQVFISSTYADLVEERKQVLDVLLMADCIPAGMENFVAQDDEQFNVIKRVIDLCDYYILILGRRYGSVNSKTGISYTEMEYDYAIEKGIPVLVFALSDDSDILKEYSGEDDVKKGKLAEFKRRAMTNRLASIWENQTDLMGKVAISVMKAKNEIVRPGWHRGSDKEKKELKAEIRRLHEEIDLLRLRTPEAMKTVSEERLKESFYGAKVTLHYTEKVMVYTAYTTIDKSVVQTTLDELFKHISVRLTGKHTVKDFINAVSSFKSGYYVDTQDALVVKNKCEQLALIHSSLDEHNNEIIVLTSTGRDVMNRLNA